MDIFETAANEIEKDIPETFDSNENVIEWLRNNSTATVSFSQKRYVNKIYKLAEKYPDKIQIVHENSDGSIVAHVPVSAISINIREGRVLTDDEKDQLRERLANARKNNG